MRTVYELLQAQKGERQVARLVHALDELAGRIESISSYDPISQQLGGSQLPNCTAGLSACRSKLRRPGQSDTWELKEVQLPDPAAGPLPLFPGGSEFEALQSAATQTASQLRSKAERHAWRSWIMAPSHFTCVIHAAWLLLALVFKQEDKNAVLLQDYVFQQLAQHYVSQVLAGQIGIDNAATLWTQAIAEAACRLLRTSFPGTNELQDPQVQQLLQRQLRLWTTGVLPSDAADTLLASKLQGADNDSSPESAQRYTKTPFVSIKPGPLVSTYMASKGLKPADLLNRPGPKVKKLTVPHHQLQQQQHQQVPQQQQHKQPSEPPSPSQHKKFKLAAGVPASTSFKGRCALKQEQQQQQQECCATNSSQQLPAAITWGGRAIEPDGTNSSVSRQPAAATSSVEVITASSDLLGCQAVGELPNGSNATYSAKAGVYLAAANDAAEQYASSKRVSAAAARRGSKAMRQNLQQLQQQRHSFVFGSRAKLQSASNSISGWLGESAAGSASIPVPAAASDAECKAQRQLLESRLRGSDWRMAHAFNAAVHDRCCDLAATVAASAPTPAMSGNSSTVGANVVGGQWAAIAGSSMVGKRLGLSKGARATGSHDIKVMKAARAIVEDVQRKFAAAPSHTTVGSDVAHGRKL